VIAKPLIAKALIAKALIANSLVAALASLRATLPKLHG
jgi:hypothetical protein